MAFTDISVFGGLSQGRLTAVPSPYFQNVCSKEGCYFGIALYMVHNTAWKKHPRCICAVK